MIHLEEEKKLIFFKQIFKDVFLSYFYNRDRKMLWVGFQQRFGWKYVYRLKQIAFFSKMFHMSST